MADMMVEFVESNLKIDVSGLGCSGGKPMSGCSCPLSRYFRMVKRWKVFSRA
jgi:hypothetical protein